MTNSNFMDLKHYLFILETSYEEFIAQFQQDQTFISLSPSSSVQFFSEIRSHEVHQKGCAFCTLLFGDDVQEQDKWEKAITSLL